jgi:tellurium resistance protein TerD
MSGNSSSPNKRKGIKVGVDFELNKNTSGFQIDFMALMLDDQGKLVSDKHFIFYNNMKSPDGSVEHLGNLLIGSNDAEQIVVDPVKTDKLVKRIIFFVYIQDADKKNLTFDKVNKLQIKFTNLETNIEIAEYQPEKDSYYPNSFLIALSELINVDNEWEIAALGDSYRVNLTEFIELLTTDYGYDYFKQQYFKNFKSSDNSNLSARNIIEKDLEDKYYKILDCSKYSSDDEIKKKYKELVKSFHPDMIQSNNLHKDIVEFAKNRFKEIKEAYEFIKEKRGF